MKKEDYFKYGIENRLYRKLAWIYQVFAYVPNIKTEYIDTTKDKPFVKVNDEWVELETSIKEPFYKLNDKITIDNNLVPMVEKPLLISLGRLLANKILIVDIFKGLIPFKDGEISVKFMEAEIVKLWNDNKIDVTHYEEFIYAVSYLQDFSRIATVSATERNLKPPTGLVEFKEKTRLEMEKEFGKDWVRDRSKVVIFENKLRDFDTEYLKGDPSLGGLISGKVKDGARTKMFLTFGAELTFDKKSGKTALVYNSLLDGIPKDKELLTNMFNTSRSGSYDRGKNTQLGGSAAKDTLRSTSGIVIVDGDCGDLVGKNVIINSSNHKRLENRFIIINNKPVLVTDSSQYIGQEVRLRSPQYCKSEKDSLCSICVGNSLSQYKKGIPILMTDITAIILATSMAAMHFKTLQNIKIDFKSTIK